MNQMDNIEITTLPDETLSDLQNLEYLFFKYKFTVERNKPSQRMANLLKTYIDIIQVKNLVK